MKWSYKEKVTDFLPLSGRDNMGYWKSQNIFTSRSTIF